jgi:hypothetical protein
MSDGLEDKGTTWRVRVANLPGYTKSCLLVARVIVDINGGEVKWSTPSFRAWLTPRLPLISIFYHLASAPLSKNEWASEILGGRGSWAPCGGGRWWRGRGFIGMTKHNSRGKTGRTHMSGLYFVDASGSRNHSWAIDMVRTFDRVTGVQTMWSHT